MGVAWTKDQQKVIGLRNRNILVSAAAGSGKTAVLVERIVQMVTAKEHPVDIDRLLIVTFTNAAAAEMRERISAAIERVLDEQPENEHLQKQMTLIHNAQITTIDSFCLYVVRNHFYEIDIEPNFRIGDEGELKLLRQDVLKKVLGLHYEEPDESFSNFIESYAPGKSDDAVTEMILNLYDFSRSYPWPRQWLAASKGCYEAASVEALDKTVWMQAVVSHMRLTLQALMASLKQALQTALSPDGPNMYAKALESDIKTYEAIAKASCFSEMQEGLRTIHYERLASSRGYEGSPEKLEAVKQAREDAKDSVKKLVKQYCFAPPKQLVEQLQKTKPAVEALIGLTEEFADAYAAEKKRKNLVDFSDIEHFALEILVDEETQCAKRTAEEFQDAYVEIMIDEYQDSNYVQEAILTSISRMQRGENNIFMVGDVKQSIYRFRLARPELFMEKYDRYSREDSSMQRIDLHQNFRSRKEVLEAVNDIFYRIMGRDLGNVVYDEHAALYPGADYPVALDMQAELVLLESEEDLLSDSEYEDKKVLEAKLVAACIRKLLREQKITDQETKKLRETRYSDIVILLRSLSGFADAFAKQLSAEGIPAHAVSSTGYFGTVEVQTVLSMLRILDNPRQDIPLAAVLKSPIGGFSEEELAIFRLHEKDVPFHACILNLCEQLKQEAGQGHSQESAADGNEAKENEKKHLALQRLKGFYDQYLYLRSKVSDTPIHVLIELVLKETGYGSYVAAMPAGERRKANIQMLVEKAIAYEKTSYKGLFHFVRYIDELQKYNVDFGEADLIGENENVVRIMSIHKSKGLEFPIVFVSGLGKSFHKQEVKSRMVLHPEYGIGLDAMDGKRRSKTPTIAKKALAKQIELEDLGEELRILYVALTRAKEKLILTGSGKRLAEKLQKYGQPEVFAEMDENRPKLLPYKSRESAASYLDWLMPAMLSYGEKYPISVLSVKQLVGEEIETRVASVLKKEERLAGIAQAEEETVKQIQELFELHYPYASNRNRKNKYSVSEIKERAMRKAFEAEDEQTVSIFETAEESVSYIPKFVQQMREMELQKEQEEGEAPEAFPKVRDVHQGALRGTAMHRILECYDFTSGLSVEQQLSALLANGRMTKELSELVYPPAVQKFLSSKTGMRMKAAALAGALYREKPFVMGLTEAELAEVGLDSLEGEESKLIQTEDDLTLIQGMIDVFWIEADGIVLLDYKTDYVKEPEALIRRYQAQIELYEKALNRVFAQSGKKVKEKLIYAFCLGKEIRL